MAQCCELHARRTARGCARRKPRTASSPLLDVVRRSGYRPFQVVAAGREGEEAAIASSSKPSSSRRQGHGVRMPTVRVPGPGDRRRRSSPASWSQLEPTQEVDCRAGARAGTRAGGVPVHRGENKLLDGPDLHGVSGRELGRQRNALRLDGRPGEPRARAPRCAQCGGTTGESLASGAASGSERSGRRGAPDPQQAPRSSSTAPSATGVPRSSRRWSRRESRTSTTSKAGSSAGPIRIAQSIAERAGPRSASSEPRLGRFSSEGT